MRLARVRTEDGVFLARIDSDKAVPLLAEGAGPGRDVVRDALAGGLDLAGEGAGPVSLDACRVLAPVREPQKVLAIGLNYADHARESGLEPPANPICFVKTPNSIIGPEDPITWRSGDSMQVDYEAELAVIVGRRARRVSESDALSYVLGYTCCNDVSARDAQFADGQWVRGKSFDSFCPLGPWIVTADEIPDPQSLAIACRIDGVKVQDSSTGEMIFGVAAVVSYLSQYLTLEPGDVIATGSPFGVGFARTPPVYLTDGAVVEVVVESIGGLRNPVVVEGVA